MVDSSDINASATESDVDSDVDYDSENDSNEDESEVQTISKSEALKQRIIEKYESRVGKQMYVRFSHRLPEDELEFETKVKSLSPLIIKAHKPRQKYARFCLVDFESQEDRDATLRTIRKASKTEENLKGIIVLIPNTEKPEYVNQIIEKKMKSVENKKAKARLKRASKLSSRTSNYTSTVVVHNLPTSASLVEVRKLFPNAVDIQIKPKKGLISTGVAAITLPSTLDARAVTKKKLTFNGVELKVHFDKQKFKKAKKPARKVKKVHNKSKQTTTTE